MQMEYYANEICGDHRIVGHLFLQPVLHAIEDGVEGLLFAEAVETIYYKV